MIEGLLFSALGFLAALALAIALAPSLWRRAEHLERKRIEAALPLTREELEGEIDAIRAHSAMAIRRLEVKADSLRKKLASDTILINVLRDRIRDLEGDTTSLHHEIEEVEGTKRSLEIKLAADEAEVAGYTTQLEELARKLADETNKVQKLSRQNDELNMMSSTLKIDLVARETEIDKLNNTIGLLRTQRREADRLAREAQAEKVTLENALQIEKAHVADLQARVDRLVRDISTRDQILERQQKELAEYGVVIPYELSSVEEPAPQAVPQDLGVPQQIASNGYNGVSENLSQETGDAMQSEDMAQLQQRVADLNAAHRKRHRKEHEAERIEQLRDEISAIAAEMVQMVAEREGQSSEINKVLSEPVREVPGLDLEARPESLASRVQKLRNAS